MTPDNVSQSITNAIQQGGMLWLVATIAAFMPSLWVMTVIFHLARPQVLRTVRKLSLRFGADVWWLGYVIMRDAVMLATFAFSLIFLFPNLLMTIPLPVTAPLASLLLFASLYVKLLYDADDNYQAYRAATLLMAVGAALYLVPQIIGIESTSQAALSGAGSFLTSTSNPGWAAPIVIAALCGYFVIGALIFYQVVVRAGRRLGQKPEVVAEETPTAA